MRLRASAAIHSRLALTLTYHPDEKRVVAELRPKPDLYVEKCPRTELHLRYMTPVVLATEFVLDGAPLIEVRLRASAAMLELRLSRFRYKLL